MIKLLLNKSSLSGALSILTMTLYILSLFILFLNYSCLLCMCFSHCNYKCIIYEIDNNNKILII